MIGFGKIGFWPHRHEGGTAIVLGSWKNVNMDVRDFLASKRTIVDADGEIRGFKPLTQYMLNTSDPLHEVGLFLWGQVCQTLDAAAGDDEGVAFSTRGNIQKGVPAFAACHAMRGDVAGENLLEQRGHSRPV